MTHSRMSKSQKDRLIAMGASISEDGVIDATEAMLEAAHIGGKRRLGYETAGLLTVSDAVGGTPAWVPDGAIAFADFVNGHYYANGAETTLTDMFVTNADWGTFNPSEVTGAGFGNTLAVLAPSVGDSFITNFTVVVDHDYDSENGAFVEVLDLPNYNMEWTLRFNSSTGITLEDYSTNTGDAELTSGVHRVAATFSSAKLAISIDGATAQSFDPSDNTPTHFAIHGSSAGSLITAITFYAPQDDADLPVLSSLGPWWNADSVIDIDLVGNRAWTLADGEVEIDTLLGSDANTVSFWGETLYDEANLTADGYIETTNAVAFIGAALDKILSGSTFVVRLKEVSGFNSSPEFGLVSADGAHALYAYLQEGYFRAQSVDGPLQGQIDNIANSGEGSINALAITIADGRFDIAANGSDALAGVVSETDRPPDTLVAAFLDLSLNRALQRITIFDALPDTTGLSALSQTGVTNTAPHDLTMTDGFPDLSGGSWADNVLTIATGNIFTGGYITSSVITVTDDEGNPLTLSLHDDGGGKVELFNVGSDTVASAFPLNADTFRVRMLEDLTESFTFALRATDPGGLYVEQEFTITVTVPAIFYDSSFEGAEISDDAAAFGSIQISECPNLETVSFSNAETCGGMVSITQCPSLTSVDLHMMKDVAGAIEITNNGASFTAIDFSSLETVNSGGSGIAINIGEFDTGAISSVTFGSLKRVDGDVQIRYATLDEATVDAILVELAGLDGTGGTTSFDNSLVRLDGVGSAPPSVTGLAAKATLEGRGCTVIVNS